MSTESWKRYAIMLNTLPLPLPSREGNKRGGTILKGVKAMCGFNRKDKC